MRSIKLILITIFFFGSIKAQDTIITMAGKRFVGKITSVDSVKVYFITKINQNEISTSIDKKDLDKLIYGKVIKYDETKHKNLFKFYYVLSKPSSSLNICYERAVGDQSSVLFYLGLPRSNTVYGEEAFEDYKKFLSDAGISGYSYSSDWYFKHDLNMSVTLSMEYRYYIKEILINPKGLYFGGGLKYYNQKDKVSFTSITNKNDEIVVNNDMDFKILYFTLGVQYLPIHYLTFDIHANPGYKFGSGTDVSGGGASQGGLTCSFYFGIGINY